MSKYCTRSL